MSTSAQKHKAIKRSQLQLMFFVPKKPVNEPKLYTFKQFALKIDWNKKEFINEEKEALLDLYETLKSSLATDSGQLSYTDKQRFGQSHQKN